MLNSSTVYHSIYIHVNLGILYKYIKLIWYNYIPLTICVLGNIKDARSLALCNCYFCTPNYILFSDIFNYISMI